MTLPTDQYSREAAYVSHYDGDSLTVNLALWQGLMFEQKSRMLGIDTPEKYAPTTLERAAARQGLMFIGSWMLAAETHPHPLPLVIRSVKMSRGRASMGDYGKYGRLLLRVWRKLDGAELGADLVNAGLARVYWGGERTAWTPAQLEAMSWNRT